MEATLTPQLDTMLEDMLKRVYSLEQRLTNPSVAVGSGSSPNFVQVTVGNPLGTNEVLSMAISPPSGLVLTPGALYDNIFVDASWTAPVDGTAAEYEVQIARKNGAAYELVMARRSVSNAVRLDGLDPNTTYGIKVYAVNSIGLLSTPLPGVGYTDVSTGVDASIPGQVTGVTATAGATSVMVSWTENTEIDVKNGAGLYEIQRATDAAFSTGLVSGKTSATLVAVTGLTAGTLLYFRVRAIDTAGNQGAWSTTVSATPGSVGGGGSDGSAPSSSPAATVVSYIGALQINWPTVVNADPTTYEVHLSATTGFTPGAGTKLGEVSGTTFLATVDATGAALSYGTTYYAKIIAKDKDGSAAAGTQGSGVIRRAADADITTLSGAKVKDGSAPSTSPTPTIQSGFGYLVARWAPVANNDPVIYEVHVSATNGFTPGAGTLMAQVDGTYASIRTLQDGSALVNGTTYYVRLIAKDADGAAAAGVQASGTPQAIVSGDVTSISGAKVKDGVPPASSPAATVVGGLGYLTAFWPAVANNDPVTYDVHVSATTGFTPNAGTLYASVDATSINIRTLPQTTTPLTYGTTYYVKIVARDADGSAAAGTQGSAAPFQVQTADVGTVSGVKVKDGAAPGSSPTPTVVSGVGVITAFWSPVANNDPVTYDVHLSATNGFTPIAGTLVASVEGTSIVIRNLPQSSTPLAYGTTYYIKIVARDLDGSAAAGAQASGTAAQAGQADIAANSITSAMVVTAGLDATVIKTGFIDAARINAGTIDASKLIVSIGGGNRINDSNFESINATIWSGANSGTCTKSATQAHSGTKSLAITTTATPYSGAGLTVTGLVVGAKYVFSAWLFATNGTTSVNFAPDSLTVTRYGTPNGALEFLLPANTWTRVWVAGTATATSVPWYLRSGNTTTAQVIYADDVQVEEGDLVTAYAPRPDEILPGTISADRLIAGTLTSASGVFGAIDAGILTAGTIAAARLAANSITTEKLTVTATSGNNLIPNGGFDELSALNPTQPAKWSDNAGGMTVNTSPFGAPRSPYSYDAAAPAGGIERSTFSYGMPMSGNKTYYWSVDYITNVNGDTNAATTNKKRDIVWMVWFDREPAAPRGNGTGLIWDAANGYIGLTDLMVGNITVGDSGWHTLSGQFTPPANAKYGCLLLGTIPQTTGGTCYQTWDNSVIREVEVAASIGNGAIIASKVAAGAITTEKLTISALNNTGMLANTGFEELNAANTFPAWWLVGGGTAARITSDFHSGSACLQLAAGGSVGVQAPVLPCAAGDWMTASGWAKAQSGPTGLYFRFSWRNSAGAEIGISDPVQNANVPGAWTYYTARSQAPAGTVNFQFQIYNVAGTVLVDDLDVRPTLGATQITPGSITSASGLFGTIDASSITTGSFAADRIGATTIDSTKIVTAGLDAAVIKFGVMHGDRIQANTITASRLTAATRSDNLVPNGNLEDGTSGWAFAEGNAAGAFYVEASSDYWQGSGSQTGVIRTDPGGTFAVSSEAFPVNPGERLTVSGKLGASTGASATYWRLFWYGAPPAGRGHDGNIIELLPGAMPFAINGAPMVAYEASAVVPANIRWARLAIYNYQSNNYLLFDNMVVTRSVTGTDITPGAITTDKINVAGLDAGHIKFGTMSGDRIQANTLDVMSIETSTLTSRTITLGSGGQILVGSTGSQGLLINDQGLRLYKAGVASIILDAITGNGTFTGTVNASGGTFSGSITSTATITGGTFSTGTSGQNRIDMAAHTINFTSTSNSPNPAAIYVQNYVPGFEAYGQLLTIYSGKTAAYPTNGAAIYVSPGNNGSGGITIQTAPTSSQAGNIVITSGRNLDIICPTLTIGDYNYFYQPTFYGSILLYSNTNNTQPRLVPALDAVNDNSRIRMWERRRLAQTMSGSAVVDTSISWIGYWDTRPVVAACSTRAGAITSNNVVVGYNVTTLSATIRQQDVAAVARSVAVEADLWLCL